ncbi:hypothetical protein CAPTEDRAFT_192152 [Capitella teleta]|uniref:Chitin-binding type-2 domain-containing protein n=1 Tax=Capitella teleta TaxID=283909 RepID=R7V972_CAPTE|nr:hypothetical protein CAPTEDRAFT_192152 [Capitella teleta]|eukprot:ELU15057.1 hypothetical protein CAPTEDRAFT_192152 [Capitella teleta]
MALRIWPCVAAAAARNDMRLMGVGECPCDEYFSPNSLSCEFQNGGYYRDAFDCNLYHRCDDTVGIVRTDGACNTMEYFNVRIPVAPTCARKENVPDCPSNAISTTAVPETTIIT